MEKKVFERLVKESLRSLPKIIRHKLENIEIVIEDEPIDQKSLLGLYQGVPLKHRGIWYGNVMPDKITILKQNIEDTASSEKEIKRIVRKVVFHEIGHYFGFDEEALRKIKL